MKIIEYINKKQNINNQFHDIQSFPQPLSELEKCILAEKDWAEANVKEYYKEQDLITLRKIVCGFKRVISFYEDWYSKKHIYESVGLERKTK
jgi:hypothetical protein